MGRRTHRLLVLCTVTLSLLAAAAAFAQDAPTPKRLALVIGNAAYKAEPLPTAANDAGLVAEVLAQDGFAVTAVADADAATLRKAIGLFAEEVRGAGGSPLVFVYMSGHGVQYGEKNYIVPVDATIALQADVPEKAVPFSDIFKPIGAVPASARIFVFDLAHPNAIAKGEPIPLATGLRHMQPPPGSVYAVNAAPGMLGRPDVPFYGIYARALAEALRTPGLDVQAIFARVRTRVAETTASAVIPWSNGELEPDVTLLAAGGEVPVGQIATRSMSGLPVQTVYWAAIAEDSLAGYQAFLRAFPNDPLSVRVEAMKAVRLEAATWAEACRADKPEAYWTYMVRYPRGPHYVDVRRRLAALHATLEPPMRFDPAELAGLPTPTSDEVNIAAKAPTTFEDAAWTPPPLAPAELLPPPPPAFYVELAPPPLVPDGALPVAAPLPGTARQPGIGKIVQPLLASGPLTLEAAPIEDDGVAVTLASDDGLITRTATKLGTGRRTIVQTDAAGEIISWTTVGETGGDLAITQTGPGGATLSRQVAQHRPGEERVTVLTTGTGKLIAETRADKQGRRSAVILGTAKAPEPTFVWGARESSRKATPAAVPAPPVQRPPPEPKAPTAPVTQDGRRQAPLPLPADADLAPPPRAEPSRATPLAATPSGASDTTATATPAAPVPVRKPVTAPQRLRPSLPSAKRRPLVYQRGRASNGRRAARH